MLEAGVLGALLRREGLYSSHLVPWRRARDRGELITAPKRGHKPKPVDPSTKCVADLKRLLGDRLNKQALGDLASKGKLKGRIDFSPPLPRWMSGPRW